MFTKRERRIGNNRLLKVTKKLDTLPPERYYHGSWVGNDWGGRSDLSCGTTACAMGWATTIPSFRRLGLRLTPGHGIVINGAAKSDRVHGGLCAAAKLFYIDLDDAERLFGFVGWGSAQPTARQVAAKIRQFVKDNPA